MRGRESGRRADAQVADRRLLQCRETLVRRSRRRHHCRASLVEGFAGFGQREAPRGSPEQGDADLLLQTLDLLAHGRRRQSKLAGAAPDRSALHHGGQHRHAPTTIHRAVDLNTE
jgi:hypothetical protein